MAERADARDARFQHADAVAVRRALEDVLPEHHFARLVHDAQVRGVDVGDDARFLDDADAVLHGFENHLEALLHQCVLMQQLVDFAQLRLLVHLEVAFEERGHFACRLALPAALGRDEERVALPRLERDELHDAVELEALATLAAQVEMRAVFCGELLRALHDASRHARVDAALVLDDGRAFTRHRHAPFSSKEKRAARCRWPAFVIQSAHERRLAADTMPSESRCTLMEQFLIELLLIWLIAMEVKKG